MKASREINDNNEHMLWEASVADAYRLRPYRKISLEEWICLYVLAAEREAGARTPSYFYGITNAVHLYLEHPAYSPFKPLPEYCTQRQRSENIAQITKLDPKTLLNSAGKFMSQEEWDAHCQAKWREEDAANAE